MLEEALQVGLEKLKKEQEAYEEAQRIISSDDLDDWLVGLTSTKVVNALSSTSNRTAFFEKIIHRITGDVELESLHPQYFEFHKTWSYVVDGKDVVLVDPKSKQAGLNPEGIFRLYAYSYHHAERQAATTMALRDWKAVLDASKAKCKGLRNGGKRKTLEAAVSQWEEEHQRHQAFLQKTDNNSKNTMNMQGRMDAFAAIGRDVEKLLSLYKESGFTIVYPNQEDEHYAIKTNAKVMRVAESDEQKRLRSALGLDVIEPKWDDRYSYGCASGFALRGPALQVQELGIFLDNHRDEGQLTYERQLDEFELQSLCHLLYKCDPSLSGVSASKEEVIFRHAILPIDYHIFANGKIKIERLPGKILDESHAFYAAVGLRSLLDMPGFVEWIASLSSNHYTKLKD
jgi:hypothetical protein